jgi:hypothetical protein
MPAVWCLVAIEHMRLGAVVAVRDLRRRPSVRFLIMAGPQGSAAVGIHHVHQMGLPWIT